MRNAITQLRCLAECGGKLDADDRMFGKYRKRAEIAYTTARVETLIANGPAASTHNRLQWSPSLVVAIDEVVPHPT
jgi:hypothetical protein